MRCLRNFEVWSKEGAPVGRSGIGGRREDLRLYPCSARPLLLHRQIHEGQGDEMAVAGRKFASALMGDGRDPNVIGGNRRALGLQI